MAYREVGKGSREIRLKRSKPDLELLGPRPLKPQHLRFVWREGTRS